METSRPPVALAVFSSLPREIGENEHVPYV
jgi:hypothetical protein